jgi:putative sigma-54 modulation protein
MQIQIKATKLELTDAIRDYIQKKMDMLEKFTGDLPVLNCHFEVGLAVGGQYSGEIYRAEINLDLNGKLLRVEKTEKDLYKAIDKVKDHVEREVIKFKEKMREVK